MKRVLDTSEVLGTVELPLGTCEVCAVAVAHYDEEAARLEASLEAFLRPAGAGVKERRLAAEWLPDRETVVEKAGPDETGPLAREIFHRWVRKVRAAVPRLHEI